jgi:microsomal dipeptidase-like Zn-dependent dipeptidase
MKVHVEIECTPEEARRFMGLPDVEKANEAYVDGIAKAMKGASNAEQLQDFARQLAPMGQMGLKMFQNFMENSQAFADGARERKRRKDNDSDDD